MSIARSRLLILFFLAVFSARGAAPVPTVEQQLAAAVKSEQVTVVHFWAPWCPNCKAELSEHGWKQFIAANPAVQVVFVTVWSEQDGRKMLMSAGLGAQKNFTLLAHPNPSRQETDRVNALLGFPLVWLPTTWVFRDGNLRFAMNYGEVRFSILQEFVRDSTDRWTR